MKPFRVIHKESRHIAYVLNRVFDEKSEQASYLLSIEGKMGYVTDTVLVEEYLFQGFERDMESINKLILELGERVDDLKKRWGLF